jgi:Flp pilus assembly protein TadG
VAVEAALVTPLICLLLFGVIEFGLVFKDYLAVASSVRAGARIASAEPRQTNFAQDAANDVAREATALHMDSSTVLWVYKAAADGTPVGGDGGFTSCTSCVKFTWNGTGFVPDDLDGWPALQQNACADKPLERDSVGVYLKTSHPAMTGLIFNSLDLKDHAVMSLEPISSTSQCHP